jgi:hypothetical protein
MEAIYLNHSAKKNKTQLYKRWKILHAQNTR